MTESEIDDLNEKEAKQKLKSFFKHPAVDIYFSVKSQMESMAAQIERLDVDITDKENKHVTDVIMEFANKGAQISETMTKLRSQIDAETFLKEKQKRLQPKRDSPEYYVLKRKGENKKRGK